MHQPQGNLGQVVVAQERPEALPRGDQDDQQRHGHQQLQVLEKRNLGQEHHIGIAQAIHEVLENPGEHWLGRSKDHEAHDTQQEHAEVRFHIAQQPEINFQAGFLVRFGRCVTHVSSSLIG